MRLSKPLIITPITRFFALRVRRWRCRKNLSCKQARCRVFGSGLFILEIAMSIDCQLEEGPEVHLDFEKLRAVAQADHPVIPVAVQDVESKAVLLIGYANQQALEHALEHRVATFWSTSRNELWIKGSTSGNRLELIDIRINCEQNSLLYLVRLKGDGACHTRENGRARYGCYYRSIRRGKLTFVDPKALPE